MHKWLRHQWQQRGNDKHGSKAGRPESNIQEKGSTGKTSSGETKDILVKRNLSLVLCKLLRMEFYTSPE